ncbi:MAG: hypothetical protein DMG05_04945 [Acidobacteria bacterium]|nr:MAG: hypothetical protein DMG05_04945 [Acidobacteriota bacterium]
MRPVFFFEVILILAGFLVFHHWNDNAQLLAQSSEASEGLTGEEKEALQKAKDPEEQLKVYLEIAGERLKAILSLSRKGDAEGTEKAVTGYRTAVSGAEDSVAKVQAAGKNTKKALMSLLKATKKFNFSLLQALEKVPEDMRQQIQSAYEVSLRVQDSVSIQLEKIEKK